MHPSKTKIGKDSDEGGGGINKRTKEKAMNEEKKQKGRRVKILTPTSSSFFLLPPHPLHPLPPVFPPIHPSIPLIFPAFTLSGFISVYLGGRDLLPISYVMAVNPRKSATIPPFLSIRQEAVHLIPPRPKDSTFSSFFRSRNAR